MKELKSLQGKTICVVYTYEGEDAPGFEHYHYWQSDIIAEWLIAIQDLHCRPYIVDVRTFVEKIIAGTMPHIDFVLNLNCGGKELSPMAIVPSLCAFFHIPCIPCDAVGILAGENKRISNLSAVAMGLNVPETLTENSSDGIFRPLNLGSSIGIKKGYLIGNEPDGIYQEFIKGYDITTPIVFNPLTKKMDFLPTIIYKPDNEDTSWFLDESYKESRSGFKRMIVPELSEQLKEKYLNLITSLSINTFCRIDARIKCESPKELDIIIKKPLDNDDVFFIELNPMPTVWTNNAFSHSFYQVSKEHTIYPYIEELRHVTSKCTVHNFLLSLSMLAYYSHVQK